MITLQSPVSSKRDSGEISELFDLSEEVSYDCDIPSELEPDISIELSLEDSLDENRTSELSERKPSSLHCLRESSSPLLTSNVSRKSSSDLMSLQTTRSSTIVVDFPDFLSTVDFVFRGPEATPTSSEAKENDSRPNGNGALQRCRNILNGLFQGKKYNLRSAMIHLSGGKCVLNSYTIGTHSESSFQKSFDLSSVLRMDPVVVSELEEQKSIWTEVRNHFKGADMNEQGDATYTGDVGLRFDLAGAQTFWIYARTTRVRDQWLNWFRETIRTLNEEWIKLETSDRTPLVLRQAKVARLSSVENLRQAGHIDAYIDMFLHGGRWGAHGSGSTHAQYPLHAKQGHWFTGSEGPNTGLVHFRTFTLLQEDLMLSANILHGRSTAGEFRRCYARVSRRQPRWIKLYRNRSIRIGGPIARIDLTHMSLRCTTRSLSPSRSKSSQTAQPGSIFLIPHPEPQHATQAATPETTPIPRASPRLSSAISPLCVSLCENFLSFSSLGKHDAELGPEDECKERSSSRPFASHGNSGSCTRSVSPRRYQAYEFFPVDPDMHNRWIQWLTSVRWLGVGTPEDVQECCHTFEPTYRPPSEATLPTSESGARIASSMEHALAHTTYLSQHVHEDDEDVSFLSDLDTERSSSICTIESDTDSVYDHLTGREQCTSTGTGPPQTGQQPSSAGLIPMSFQTVIQTTAPQNNASEDITVVPRKPAVARSRSFLQCDDEKDVLLTLHSAMKIQKKGEGAAGGVTGSKDDALTTLGQSFGEMSFPHILLNHASHTQLNRSIPAATQPASSSRGETFSSLQVEPAPNHWHRSVSDCPMPSIENDATPIAPKMRVRRTRAQTQALRTSGNKSFDASVPQQETISGIAATFGGHLNQDWYS